MTMGPALFGRIAFRDGEFLALASSGGWSVRPILGFKGSTSVFPPDGLRLPLGQVEIAFDQLIEKPYAVIVAAEHNERMPFVAANWGGASTDRFVVHLWETAADRTLVNAGFSFALFIALDDE